VRLARLEVESKPSRYDAVLRILLQWAGAVGHNLPQEAPQAFAQAIVDADAY